MAAAAVAIGACDGKSPTQPSAPAPLGAVNQAGVPFPVEYFVQAHQDDWQLFLGDRAAGAAPTAAKVVFIYTTAGNAGSTTDGYWQARERAAQASIDSMTPAATWTCASQTVNGHVIQRCAKGTVVSYYLRLPDGNGDGQGYAPAHASLQRLRSGAVATLSAVNGSTTYASWNDLVATIRAIITAEAGGRTDPSLAVHAPEYDREANAGDHSDHQHSGDLVRAASVGRTWNLFWYIGYPSLYQPRNLTNAQVATKWKLILAYDRVLKADYGTIIGTSHAEEWSERTIFRTEWSTGEPPPPPTTVPVAPTALLAVPSGGTGIDLTWTDNSSDEASFRVERAPDVDGAPGTFAEVATVLSGVTTYASTDVVANTRYWFRVRAVNVVGPSAYTNTASAILLAPAAPTTLAAVPFSATRIDLTWADNAPDEQGYRIERAPDVAGVAGTWAEIATVGPNVTVYSNTSLQNNTRYWYRVRAYNVIGTSAYSNEAAATTPVPPASTFPIEIYLGAHQDDWQLFFGNRVASSVQNAGKVVLVYTTAGESGDPGTGYWTAREAGANASVDSMTVAGAWACANQTINAHVIRRCTKANTVSYYMRLPDGNSDGRGYGSGSLDLLRAGTIGSLSAVNGSTTYASWGDLVSTVRALVVFETTSQADASVGVHVTDWDTQTNDGDHPDHMTTGALVRAASVTRAWNLFWYVGYPNLFQPANLSPAEQAIKWKLIVAYDDVLKANYGTIIGTSNAEEWVQRTIFRTEPSSGTVAPLTPPIAPSNLSAVSFQGTRIDLTWNENAVDEQGYRIERAPDAGGVPGVFTQIASVGLNVRTYSNTGVSANTRYWYRVRAYNAVGTSPYSNDASAIMTTPPAPTALTTTPVTGVRIDLAWTDNSGTEEQGFRVERAPDVGGAPGTYALIASVAANIRTYSNTGLQASTRYWYRVRAYNAVGTSDYTNESSAATLSPPVAASGLTAVAASATRINLTWTDNSADEQGFRVERAPDVAGAPGTYTQITSVGVNVQTYGNTGLVTGTSYWYRVRAYNAVGTSAYTDAIRATTLAPPPVPTGLQGTTVSSGVIDISFIDVAGETSYRLERAPDVAGVAGTFGSAVTLGADVTSYRVTGLAATTTYWFRVRATNAIGNSAFSAPVRVTTMAVSPPTGLAANSYVVGTVRNVDLTWTRGSEPTVDIFRNGTRVVSGRVNDGGPYNNQPSTTLGTTVSYQVCAAGKTGAANCSAVVSVTF